MALLRSRDIRAMRPEDRRSKLRELNDELMHERGVAAMGGAPASPGKMKALRKNIARIITIEREHELGLERPEETPASARKRKERPKAEETPRVLEEEPEGELEEKEDE